MAKVNKSKNIPNSVWQKKDRAEDWRSIWHSLVAQKDIDLSKIKDYIDKVDKVYAHLQAVREEDLEKKVKEEKNNINPF